MNNTTCEMVKDLIPLYVDGVCSEGSKVFIREHLEECEECRKYLASIEDGSTPVIPDSEIDEMQKSETSFLKKVKHKIAIQKLVFCGTLFAIVFGLFVLYENPMENELLNKIPVLDKRISITDVQISEVCQLKNGYVYFTLTSKKPFSIQTYQAIASMDKNTSYTESFDNGYNVVTVKRSRWEEMFGGAITMNQVSFAVPLSENMDGAIHESDHLYYEGKNGEKITIWKEGETLEKAPDWIESKVVDLNTYNKVIVCDDVVNK